MGAAPGAGQGQQGEMIPGQQAAQGMPEGSTVSPENAQQAPTEGVPLEMQSPLTMGQKGGGYNLIYLARRAATALGKMDEGTKMQSLEQMKMQNPQLYSIVLSMLNKERGSQSNPLNAAQSPQPTQKPSRRAAPVG